MVYYRSAGAIVWNKGKQQQQQQQQQQTIDKTKNRHYNSLNREIMRPEEIKECIKGFTVQKHVQRSRRVPSSIKQDKIIYQTKPSTPG